MTEPNSPPDRAQELKTFLVLSILLAPVLAVGLVSGYGFLVWILQMLAGPPGAAAVSGS